MKYQKQGQTREKSFYSFKFVVLGEPAVGKTSLIMRFVRNTFSEYPNSSIQPEFMFRNYEISDRVIRLNIWDTGLDQKFKPLQLMPQYRADGIVFVYSTVDRHSFDRIKFWIEDVKKQHGQQFKKMLIGTKIDQYQNRQVSQNDGQSLADEFEMLFIETSAKEDINVTAAFISLADEIYEGKYETQNMDNQILFQINNRTQSTTQKQSCAC